MAKRIDGKAIAAQIKQELKEQVQQLAKDNITVTLAVIQVGQDPASCVYVRNKQRTCEELGIHSLSYELEETTSEEKLLSLIQELNAREDVDGILVQLPLPGHINEKDVLNAIDPAKDVDGFHPYNVCAASGAFHRRLLLLSIQFFISMAIVIGPTPPGTGVIAEATGNTLS